MTGKNNGIFAFGHDVQTVTDNLTFYTSTAKRNGGIKVNGLTDYQNRQMEKMLKFLRGIDLSQEEIQTLIWLAGWFVTQFLSHEWYTLFGRGFMGKMDKKIAYFSECIQLINVDGRYVPDVYHIVLHILIIIAFVVTLLYREKNIS